jgi:23S rRNA (cytosine1962-C5)-methyltransferase
LQESINNIFATIPLMDINVVLTDGWEDYELIDSGDGYRLERFGKYILSRPDPQVIWKKKASNEIWEKADAIFQDGWINNGGIPERWIINYQNISMYLKLSPFKHTGIFPEQKNNWDFIEEQIKKAGRETNFLNLFGYTGISSLVAANAGAKVTHLDASRPAMTWFRENQEASKLIEKPIRLIVDDAIKFTGREITRGTKYDAVIMDPPIYGHDPKGKVWDFEKDFPQLMENVGKILSDNPLFVIVNAYAISASALMLGNVMEDYLGKLGGKIEVGELALKEKTGERFLSTGIFAKWSA